MEGADVTPSLDQPRRPDNSGPKPNPTKRQDPNKLFLSKFDMFYPPNREADSHSPWNNDINHLQQSMQGPGSDHMSGYPYPTVASRNTHVSNQPPIPRNDIIQPMHDFTHVGHSVPEHRLRVHSMSNVRNRTTLEFGGAPVSLQLAFINRAMPYSSGNCTSSSGITISQPLSNISSNTSTQETVTKCIAVNSYIAKQTTSMTSSSAGPLKHVQSNDPSCTVAANLGTTVDATIQDVTTDDNTKLNDDDKIIIKTNLIKPARHKGISADSNIGHVLHVPECDRTGPQENKETPCRSSNGTKSMSDDSPKREHILDNIPIPTQFMNSHNLLSDMEHGFLPPTDDILGDILGTPSSTDTELDYKEDSADISQPEYYGINCGPKNTLSKLKDPLTDTMLPSNCTRETPNVGCMTDSAAVLGEEAALLNAREQLTRLEAAEQLLEVGLNSNVRVDMPKCDCLGPGVLSDETIEGPYYTHLGSGRTITAIRTLVEARFGEEGGAVRIEKVLYTGKEGRSTQGCPVAKWIIRRSSVQEKVLVIVRERSGHRCASAVMIVAMVAWDGVPPAMADNMYEYMTHTLPDNGFETERRCATNGQRTCACQGWDNGYRGASFSFGCAWSMFYNGCKFSRSKTARKFKLKKEDEEPVIEKRLEDMATHLGPLYEQLAPDAFSNQSRYSESAQDCRLGTNEPGKRPFSGVTAVVDFCAHAHRDVHNMNNGSTVVVTLTKHRGLSKPEDEQLHVLPLYVIDPRGEKGNGELVRQRIEAGSIEMLHKYRTVTRVRAVPLKPCKLRSKTNKNNSSLIVKRKPGRPPRSPKVSGEHDLIGNTPKHESMMNEKYNQRTPDTLTPAEGPGSVSHEQPNTMMMQTMNEQEIMMKRKMGFQHGTVLNPTRQQYMKLTMRQTGFDSSMLRKRAPNLFSTDLALSRMKPGEAGLCRMKQDTTHRSNAQTVLRHPIGQQSTIGMGQPQQFLEPTPHTSNGPNQAMVSPCNGINDTSHHQFGSSSYRAVCQTERSTHRSDIGSYPHNVYRQPNQFVHLAHNSNPGNHENAQQCHVSARSESYQDNRYSSSTISQMNCDPAHNFENDRGTGKPAQNAPILHDFTSNASAREVLESRMLNQGHIGGPGQSIANTTGRSRQIMEPASLESCEAKIGQSDNSDFQGVYSNFHIKDGTDVTKPNSSTRTSPVGDIEKIAAASSVSNPNPTTDEGNAEAYAEHIKALIEQQKLHCQQKELNKNIAANAGAVPTKKSLKSTTLGIAVETPNHDLGSQPDGSLPSDCDNNPPMTDVAQTSHVEHHDPPPSSMMTSPPSHCVQFGSSNTGQPMPVACRTNPDMCLSQRKSNNSFTPTCSYNMSQPLTNNSTPMDMLYQTLSSMKQETNHTRRMVGQQFAPQGGATGLLGSHQMSCPQAKSAHIAYGGDVTHDLPQRPSVKHEHGAEHIQNQGNLSCYPTPQVVKQQPSMLSHSGPSNNHQNTPDYPASVHNNLPPVMSNSTDSNDVTNKHPDDVEYDSDNEGSFRDNAVGGVAIALTHGSVLFECAKRELHATTALKKPNRYHPTRISLVFYQHKKLNAPKHGLYDYERKMEILMHKKKLGIHVPGGTQGKKKLALNGGLPPKQRKRKSESLVKAIEWGGKVPCGDTHTTSSLVTKSGIAIQQHVAGPYAKWVDTGFNQQPGDRRVDNHSLMSNGFCGAGNNFPRPSPFLPVASTGSLQANTDNFRRNPHDFQMIPHSYQSAPTNFQDSVRFHSEPTSFHGAPTSFNGRSNDVQGLPNNFQGVPTNFQTNFGFHDTPNGFHQNSIRRSQGGGFRHDQTNGGIMPAAPGFDQNTLRDVQLQLPHQYPQEVRMFKQQQDIPVPTFNGQFLTRPIGPYAS